VVALIDARWSLVTRRGSRGSGLGLAVGSHASWDGHGAVTHRCHSGVPIARCSTVGAGSSTVGAGTLGPDEVR
jgi:hypothetical protein